MTEKEIRDLQILNLDGKATVSSLVVAEKFNKKHAHILRDIEDLEIDDEFRQSNFGPANYLDKQGKPRPMFYMSRDGFVLLIMGYTGKEAMALKVRYIKAFNMMEGYIRNNMASKDAPILDWGQARLMGKTNRLELTDAIKYLLIPMAIEQGSRNSDKLYISYSKLLNKEFIDDPDFEIPRRFNRRNCLSAADLIFVGELEKGIAKIIVSEVELGTHYKEVYKKIKEKVVMYAEDFGKRKAQLPEKGPVPLLSESRKKDE